MGPWNPVNSPVEVGSWNPIIYRGFSTIQTVVGNGISAINSHTWCKGTVLWVGVIQRGTRRKHIPKPNGICKESRISFFGGYYVWVLPRKSAQNPKTTNHSKLCPEACEQRQQNDPKKSRSVQLAKPWNWRVFQWFLAFLRCTPRKFTCTPKKETMRKLHLPTINFQRICYSSFHRGYLGKFTRILRPEYFGNFGGHFPYNLTTI